MSKLYWKRVMRRSALSLPCYNGLKICSVKKQRITDELLRALHPFSTFGVEARK